MGAILSAPLNHFWRATRDPLQTSLTSTVSHGSFLMDYMQTYTPPNSGLNVVHIALLVSSNHLQLYIILVFPNMQSWTPVR